VNTLYRATNFSVIQTVYEKEGLIYLLDYIGRTYNYEDVTDDGEVFDPLEGWKEWFFLKEDIHIIRKIRMIK
jgi:hypothetical protein